MRICIFAPVGLFSIGGRVQRIVDKLRKNNEIIWVDPIDVHHSSNLINSKLIKKNIQLISPPESSGNVVYRTLTKERYNLNIIKQTKNLDVCIFYEGWGTFFVRHYLKNKGIRNTRETSIAKYYCSEMVNRVAYKAIQIHGGYGFSGEYDVERFYRDARINTLYEGTSQIQQLIIGAYELGIKAFV